MYAIMEVKNKQVRVEKGGQISVNLLQAEPGKEVVFDKVLLVNKDGAPVVGQPTVPNAKVVCEVVRHFRGDKVVAYKFRRRKNSQMKKGHRTELTELKVKEIVA
ncbi:MAG: 50S ribosomal protein L21 [Candidatus Omnitrophica bacterium]|nr:50S ribosomal protein L21 [Candidatus Omnitrophota bacterium]